MQLNISCHAHRCYYSLPYIRYNLVCDISSLHAKAMIPNEMPDGKKIVTYTQGITPQPPPKVKGSVQ